MAGSTQYYLFPQEGLNQILNIVPKGSATFPATNYLGLFSTAWSTISGYIAPAGNINVTLNTGTNVVTEISTGGYARQGLVTASWNGSSPSSGSYTVNGVAISGQYYTTVSGFTFTCTSGTWTVNGVFVCSGATAGSITSGVYFYAPFSDLQPVTVASGDSIVVTPTWVALPYPN